jgi:hypothetical protein
MANSASQALLSMAICIIGFKNLALGFVLKTTHIGT